MPANSYVMLLIKDINKIKAQHPLINTELKVHIKEEDKASPRTKEIMRKNCSIDDFMKHQIPWIL